MKEASRRCRSRRCGLSAQRGVSTQQYGLIGPLAPRVAVAPSACGVWNNIGRMLCPPNRVHCVSVPKSLGSPHHECRRDPPTRFPKRSARVSRRVSMGPRDLLRDVRHGDTPVESQAERVRLYSTQDGTQGRCARSSAPLCHYFAGPRPPTDASGAVPSTQSPTRQRPRIAGPNLETGALPIELRT